MAAQSLGQALSALVDEGVLTPAQAEAVHERVGDVERAGAPEESLASPPAALRQRLVEAAVYLGIAFVLAAVSLVIAQRWRELSQPTRVVLTGGLSAAALLAGLALARRRSGDRDGGDRDGDDRVGVRRRSASVMLTASAALAAGTVVVVMGDGRATGSACFATALLVLVLAHGIAPTLLTEVALFTATAGLAVTTATWLVPEPTPGAAPEDWQRYSRTIGFVLAAAGALWAWVVARALRVRSVAVSLGLAMALLAGIGLNDGREHLVADVTLAALGVAALVTYLRSPAWPWIVGAVAAATLLVFSAAGSAFGSALAFLLAGLILLAGVGVVLAVRRRRTRRR